MVPKGWEKNSLDSLFEFKNGLNTEKEQYGNGYKFVNVMDVFRNDILTESKIIGRVQVTDKQLEGYQLKYGDVLFNRTSETFDEIAIAAIYLDNAIATFGGFVIRARPKGNQIDPAYSVFLFQSKSYRSQVVKLGQGAIRANIGQKDLARVCILVPPLAEQKKIAQILSTWDKAISVTEKLLTNSQQQKKALMQQLLSGKKRLLDENGVMFSGEWEVVRLKQLIHEEKKRNRDNHIQRVLSVTNHSGFVLPEEQFSKRVASEDVSTYKIVKKNQYGYNPSRLNVGSFARLDNYDEGVLSPMYVVFSINHERLNSDYFLNWMSSNEAKQRIAGSTQGSVRDSVGFDALCSFSFSLPTLMEQQKIAAVLSAADAEMSMLEKKLACLKEEKKALMQQLLTGKRRVKVESEETVSA
ncbi:restriction endonuclease subunit S [Escherichia coli]|uniref:restriction endonuclease subunit S n=1 Tax=Escherichia coli TaxID=562 RepID=UPI002FE5275F